MRFPIPRRLRPAMGACMSLAAVSAVALGVLPQQQGTVDLLTQANVTVSGAAANDSSGYSVAAAGDLNGDGRDDVIVGAYTADPSSRSDAGSSYVIYGSSSPTDVDLASLGSRGFRIDGAAAFDNSGRSVAAAGDVNGDGRDDVIVGAYGASPSSRSLAGSSYVIYGSSSPTDVDLASLGSRGFRIAGAAANNFSGSSVAAAGDVNGDGRDDVIVGAYDASPSALSNAGSSYVIYGSSSPTDVDLASLGSRGFRIDGAAAFDNSGRSVAAAGDLNGDGRDDVIVGANNASPSALSNAGSSYVIYGSSSPTDVDLASLGSRGVRIDGAATNDQSGSSVAAAGDVNGDGRDDVIVGAMNASPSSRSSAGSSYVIYGSSSPTDVDLASLGSRGFRIAGAAANDFSGRSVAAAGDLNGDGRDDVIVGADGADPSSRSDAGSSYVIYGSSSPTDVDLASLGSRGFRIDGAATNDQSGSSVAAAGDLNGDGRDDVIVGAPQAHPSSRSYVIYGFGTASVSYPGAITATVGTPIANAVPTVRRTGTAAFSVSPALPAGLSLDASTGVISGTPAQASSAISTVSMTDLTGTATTTVSVTATTTATTTGTTPAALTVTLVASRRAVVSGQRLRIGIRAANIGLAAAGSVSACVRLPSNMVITAAAGAVRSGRTACFRMGSVAPGSTVAKVLTVRAVSTRRAVVTITGTARASAASRVRANPLRVTITPRAARARVTG